MNDNLSKINYKISGIREIIFQKKLINNLPDLIPDYPAIVIADKNTIQLLPNIVFSAKNLKFIILQSPRADLDLIDFLKKHIENCKTIVALGAGTITDLCKYLAFITKKKYIVFCTAASVNAYTSPNASIINYSGKKKSMAAEMPDAIYVDDNVIFKSPKRLLISGLYDLLCNNTVIFDCYISHILLGTCYNQELSNIISRYIKFLIRDFQRFSHDVSFRRLLMEALLVSGLAMWANGDSRSASQGEHQIAHLLERKYNKIFLHGELVAAGTIFTSLLQENLFNGGKVAIDPYRYKKYNSRKHGILLNIPFDHLQQELNRWKDYLADLTKNHDSLRKFIYKTYIILPKFDRYFAECTRVAFLTRERFTCLDLAYLCKLQH